MHRGDSQGNTQALTNLPCVTASLFFWYNGSMFTHTEDRSSWIGKQTYPDLSNSVLCFESKTRSMSFLKSRNLRRRYGVTRTTGYSPEEWTLQTTPYVQENERRTVSPPFSRAPTENCPKRETTNTAEIYFSTLTAYCETIAKLGSIRQTRLLDYPLPRRRKATCSWLWNYLVLCGDWTTSPLKARIRMTTDVHKWKF